MTATEVIRYGFQGHVERVRKRDAACEIRCHPDYAGLLAEKLDEKGEARQASMILAKACSCAAGNIFPCKRQSHFPVDAETRLHTFDEKKPSQSDVELALPDNAKIRLNEFIASVRAAEKLAAARLCQPARLLLSGPPGCGKTQAARMIAAELSLPLLTVRCDTLVSSLLGQSSRNLRRM